MTYDAIVESTQSKGYRATLLGWPNCSEAGATREEALAKLQSAVHERLARAEIVRLEVDAPEATHSWRTFAGRFQGDPLFDEAIDEISKYRRQLDTAAESIE